MNNVNQKRSTIPDNGSEKRKSKYGDVTDQDMTSSIKDDMDCSISGCGTEEEKDNTEEEEEEARFQEELGQQLLSAAASGDLASVRQLLEIGLAAPDNPYCGPAVVAAADGGFPDVIDFLVSHGCDVNSVDDTGATALHRAAYNNNLQLVQHLTRQRANIDVVSEEGRTPVMEAARRGCPDVVRCLIEERADLESVTALGESVMHMAAQGGSTAAIKALYFAAWRLGHRIRRLNKMAPDSQVYAYLEKLDLNRHDVYGQTPLHHAAFRGHPSAVNTLIQLGAAVDPADSDKSTPLHVAVCLNHVECVRTLLFYTASTKRTDNAGWTALHKAAHWGREEIAHMLVKAGSKVTVRDHEGQTPRDLAVKKYRKNIVHMIDNFSLWRQSVREREQEQVEGKRQVEALVTPRRPLRQTIAGTSGSRLPGQLYPVTSAARSRVSLPPLSRSSPALPAMAAGSPSVGGVAKSRDSLRSTKFPRLSRSHDRSDSRKRKDSVVLID